MDRLDVPLVFTFPLFQLLEPHHHGKASNHFIISKLIHHFHLHPPPTHKYFYPFVHLLSLYEKWAPASSLANFNLYGRLLFFLPL